jgi:hypothetical protein
MDHLGDILFVVSPQNLGTKDTRFAEEKIMQKLNKKNRQTDLLPQEPKLTIFLFDNHNIKFIH